jgi:Glyoxalase-like domain/Family of unknown function (DUF5937)
MVSDSGAIANRVRPSSATLRSIVSAGLQQLGVWHRETRTHLRWIRWASDELAARPLAMPRTWPLIVNDRPGWPQFLLPAPDRAGTTIDDCAAELAAHPAEGLRAIAAELREAHDRLIAPHWPRIRAVLDTDITYRARQLAADGAAQLFADLHPDLHWTDGRLTLTDVARGDRVSTATAPGGLVLVPLVLGPPYVLVKLRTTTQTTIRYPARGVGALWATGTRPASRSAVRLLGRPRGRVARGAAVTRDDHRPRASPQRHAERGVPAPPRPARRRPRRRRAERAQRALPDHRAWPGSAQSQPRIMFEPPPEGFATWDELHLDLSVSSGRSVPMQERKRRVDAEAQRFVALGATLTAPVPTDGLDHYGVAMTDPEGTEFDIN